MSRLVIQDEESNCTFMINTIKSVGRQIIKPKQLLLIPITIYDGLLLGFVFSDLTRAYSSCVMGFANVSFQEYLYVIHLTFIHDTANSS